MAAMTSTSPCSMAITSRTRTARASCTRRPATAARTSTSGWPTPRSCSERGIDTTIPFTVDADGALHQGGAGLRGQARHRRQGRQGRRQRRRHQGAGRGQRADRARPPQAPVSALLALQEAGDLPQHAAVVHRHGQAARRVPHPHAGRLRGGAAIDGFTLRELALQCHRARPSSCRASGPEPPARHDRGQARLGDLAPARLGRADHRVPHKDDGRGDPVGDVRQVGRADGAHPHGHDREGRRRLVRAGRARSASSAAGRQPRRLGAGRPTSRRVVRLRLHARLHAGGPGALSRASPASSASATAATTASCTWKAPTSTAAGSSPRCWKAAARAAARPSTSC